MDKFRIILFCCIAVAGAVSIIGCGAPHAVPAAPAVASPDATPPATPDATPPQSSSVLPTPPSNALTFSSLEHNYGWGSCAASDCAGGSGNASYWTAQNQAAPSLDGNSIKLFNSGTWANALWWLKLGAHNNATNLLWDFYFQVDETSLNAAQALEFDVFQFINGYNYMIGSQCDYGNGYWDIWDEESGWWIPTSISCPKFSPATWHHIQWYVQRTAGDTSYRYVTLVVDGTPYTVNQSYKAKYVGWSDDLGAQYQIDVNASGVGYPMWVDKSTLTVW